MSNRLDQEREKRLQPKRMAVAKLELNRLGFEIYNQTETSFNFDFKGNKITYFPYSGWHSGKAIKDGRGLQNLLKQLKQ